MTKGYVYISFGDVNYLAQTYMSIYMLRKQGVKEDILVLTDTDNEILHLPGVTVQVIPATPGAKQQSRDVKTQLNSYSIFDRTLYIDSDIICLKNPDTIWEHTAPLCISYDLHHTVASCNHSSLNEKNYTMTVCPNQYQWNSGVILFDKSSDAYWNAFWHDWHTEWQRYSDIDQLALSRALFNLNISPDIIQLNFNCQFTGISDVLHLDVIFWHSWAQKFVYYEKYEKNELYRIFDILKISHN